MRFPMATPPFFIFVHSFIYICEQKCTQQIETTHQQVRKIRWDGGGHPFRANECIIYGSVRIRFGEERKKLFAF